MIYSEILSYHNLQYFYLRSINKKGNCINKNYQIIYTFIGCYLYTYIIYKCIL